MAWRQGKDKMTQTRDRRKAARSPSHPTWPHESVKTSSSPLMLCVNKETHEPFLLLKVLLIQHEKAILL